ncbi:hypothetical protein [Reyranella sp.]
MSPHFRLRAGHLAWKVALVIGLIAGTMQLLTNDRPPALMQAWQPATT